MIRRVNLHATAGLVAVAIAGLLIMHGVDVATLRMTDADQPASQHDDQSESHGALGVCVFVASIAGIGLAAVAVRRRHPGSPVAVRLTNVPGRRSIWSAPSGRSRLIDLSVLRL